MKTPVILILTLSACLLPVSADDNVSPDVAAIGMLPNQRTAQRFGANERNPFAFKPKEPAKAAVEETETQESKIRAIFKLMNVSGVRRGTDGKLVALVGDLILREGEEVRQVLPEQTELLMVSRIEPKKIELTFVENKDSTQPRTIVLPITGQTRVAERLAGQAKGGKTMYFPRLRAAAAGVAALLSASGGSGAHPASQAMADETGSPSASPELSGVGTITAPPPAVSPAERPERMSFAALAPPGNSPGSRGETPATPPAAAPRAGHTQPAPPAPALGPASPPQASPPRSPAHTAAPSAQPSAPVPLPANTEPKAVPPPARPAPPPVAPVPATKPEPTPKATGAVPNPAPPPPATPKPIRLTVPPPPASQAPPVVE